MIKNYFKIAFRGFWKHKLFTLINIIGLSIGISAALVIYLIVHFDFTFDKFHKDGDRIYRVVTNLTLSGEPFDVGGVTGALSGAVNTQVAGVDASAPFFILGKPDVIIEGNKGAAAKFKKQDNIILADERYFNLFKYKWLAGSPKNAFKAPYQVVLTSDEAKKYFPGLSYHQMIGKIINYDTIKTSVTGIVQTLNEHTDFIFHDFISYSTITANKDLKAQVAPTDWENTNSASQLFIKLSPKSTVANIERQIKDIRAKNIKPGVNGTTFTQVLHLQPLNDLHFNEKYGNFGGVRANKTTLYGLLLIALFLLILGCINFVNLTTAQATQRAKEIGIRKTMGSSRRQLICQFLSETFLLTLFAVIISVTLSPVILKLFAAFIPAGIMVDLFHQPYLMLFLLALTIVVSLLSGFYPAIMLSGYKPVMVLKNQAVASSSQTRNAWLRKSLTVTQFVIAQFFIMATVLVSKQVYYALHKNLGFKKEAILIISAPFKNNQPTRNTLFFNKLRSIPQVELVSIGNDAPSYNGGMFASATYIDGKKEIKTDIQLKYGDENYINVYKIKLLAGRKLQNADTSSALLINETYAKVLGFKNPAGAVGKTLNYSKSKYQIVGVVADFYQQSLHAPIVPLVIHTSTNYKRSSTFHIALKPQTANGDDWKSAIAGMARSWKEIYPDDDFEYHFFDENIAKFYESEQHTSTLLSWATGLSILISCLGLLGLAIYTTNQRTKEIGVRKVLGATVTQIVTLLSTELIVLIILAFVIVTPVAWWAMNKWMQNFADRTAISWWIFALSGAGMLVTAVITSSFQTVKAAIANPVKSLRSE